jgi:hypothetical protein
MTHRRSLVPFVPVATSESFLLVRFCSFQSLQQRKLDFRFITKNAVVLPTDPNQSFNKGIPSGTLTRGDLQSRSAWERVYTWAWRGGRWEAASSGVLSEPEVSSSVMDPTASVNPASVWFAGPSIECGSDETTSALAIPGDDGERLDGKGELEVARTRSSVRVTWPEVCMQLSLKHFILQQRALSLYRNFIRASRRQCNKIHGLSSSLYSTPPRADIPDPSARKETIAWVRRDLERCRWLADPVSAPYGVSQISSTLIKLRMCLKKG